MTEQRPRYDGLGIAMLGLGVLMLLGITMAGFIRAPASIDDSGVQQSMAWANWAMVVVSTAGGVIGALSLYLIYRTLHAAHRSAVAAEKTLDETRTIGRAQVRAYVSARELKIVDSLFGPLLVFQFHNTGQSPALGLRASATLAVAYQGDDLAIEQTSRAYANLQAGDTATRELSFHLIAMPDLWVAAGEDVLFLRLTLIFTFDYTDVFGDKHEVKDARYLALITRESSNGEHPILLMEHVIS